MVRMGLHTGESHERDGNYFGPAVNRAARVMDAANGRQILVSSATREVVGGELGGSTTLVDLGVHELRDVIEPVRLYRVDDGAFASDPRPPRTGGVRAGNLPTGSGVLLGRDADLEAVAGDLAAARVVTLTGVGGIGKTRLALEVGRGSQTEWRDGVWFAALDTIDTPDAMLRALLGLLGIEPRSQPDLDSLIEGLRFRDSLLILDNCEHLLDAVAEATNAIVSSCPGVRVLATSREPLDVEGERVRRVRSLATDEAVHLSLCSACERRRSARRSTPTATWMPSFASAAVSMASRSPSSSPPRGHDRCARPRSPIVSTTCSGC